MSDDEEDEFAELDFTGYRVVGLLGRGAGGGAVYEVWSVTGGRRAAAKWPIGHKERDVLRELTAEPGCLGVPRLFSDGELDGKLYAVVEILGKPLSETFDRLRGSLRCRWLAVSLIGRLLLRRLRAMHVRGFVHCDLKPENVLVGSPSGSPDQHNRPYLVDFGTARKFPGGEPLRGDLGSVDYNSISSADGGERRPSDDLESLGWVLLHGLFGELPWFTFTKNTDWKDKPKRFEAVQQVQEAKAQALDEGWQVFGDKFRKLSQTPKDLESFLKLARGTNGASDEAGSSSPSRSAAGPLPDYRRLAALLGARPDCSEVDAEAEDLHLLPLALEWGLRRSRLGEEADSENGGKVVWEVVGGGDAGGILVRKGKEISSAAEHERLATGALVQEEELDGTRLRYQRLLGGGPSSGWVSLRLKERELVKRLGTVGFLLDPEERRSQGLGRRQRNDVAWWADWEELFEELQATAMEAAKLPTLPSQMPGPPAARVDVLVFGATGATGMLACAWLLQLLPGRTWAIAGRSERKLQLLTEEFRSWCSCFRGATRAESWDEVERLVATARVVVDFSGPKFKVGTVVAEACVRSGAHYIDTTTYEGDVLFARHARDKLGADAKRRGVCLLYFCSAFPVQVDFGTWLLVAHLRDKLGVPTRRVDVYQRLHGLVLSGTALLGFVGQVGHAAELRRCQPFVLGGVRPEGPRDEDVDEPVATQDEASGVWLFPGGQNAEVMIGRCSCGLFDGSATPYGKRFLLKNWDIHPNQREAEMPSSYNAFVRTAYQSLLLQEKIPAPGQGAAKSTRMAGNFVRIFEAKADESGISPGKRRRRAHCVLQPGSLGVGDACEGTAIVALEAAGCLLEAADAGRGLRPGFGTPTWHLGHLGFCERLVERGYWTWSAVTDSSPPPLLLRKALATGPPARS